MPTRDPERRLRAPLAVERDDAGAAGSRRVARCPTRPTWSSSVAATPGSTPRASWRVAASGSRSSRRRRSAGAPRPATAGSSTPGYKWGPRELIERYGEATGAALYRETLDGYETVKRLIAEESIDCDFREVGHVELAYAASHVAGLEHEQAALASVGVEASMLPRERSARRSAPTPTTGRSSCRAARLLHPGRYFAGLAAAADRAGADLHERVRARTIRRQADGRFVVETDRGAILARDVVVATNGYTDGVAPTLRRRIIPIGSYIIASEPLPDDLVARLSPQGPGVLRHEELPVLLAHLGGPADGLRRPGEHAADVDRPDRARSSTAACSRSTRSWPAVGSTTRGAATSASRSTGCRTSGGRATASPTRWAAAAPGSR